MNENQNMIIEQSDCRTPKWCVCYEFDKDDSEGNCHGCFHPQRQKDDKYWYHRLDVLMDSCPLKSGPLTIQLVKEKP